MEYAQQGRIAEAVEQLGKIRQPTSDDHSWRGELLIHLGPAQFENAGAAFREALKIDSQSGRALYGLAVLGIVATDFVKAEEFARKAVEVQPKNAHAKNILAGALMYQQKYGEAEALLLTLEREPAIATIAKGNLGELYFRQGRLDAAEARLKEAIREQPNNFDWHRWLGEVYRLQGNKSAALAEYRETLRLLERAQWADKALIEEMRARVREAQE